ncbi:hypothetical protein [Streptomyces sp. NPDC096068]|uniref:hypothetical protein n=1 Tax=Streptomyces sp. NPDC096068 TaxID=3155424 RepID=UPI00332C7085
MPRRRPEAVRAERWRPRGHVVVRRIHGVSARTRAAVRRVEEERVRPGAVADALARIDEEFERRTLPNPRPVRVRASDGWWWARTRER